MTTLSDVQLSLDEYTELYAATGIPVGTEVLIQNKCPHAILLQTCPTEPLADSWDGFVVMPFDFMVGEQGSTGIWARGDGRIAVEARV